MSKVPSARCLIPLTLIGERQINGFEVPNWIRDRKLEFEKPYYHSRRMSDFDKVKLQYTIPAPFRTRNVYFDSDSVQRI